MAHRETANSIVAHIRDITELDTSDVSTSVLKLYMRDGYNRIIDLERRWNFLEVSFTFNTIADQNAYTINDYTAYDMREIVSMVDPDNARLSYISYDVAEEQFLGPMPVLGQPLFYSMWADQIHLFPTPIDAFALTVRGYRNPDDWITDGTIVDGPDAFDIPLVYYVISRIYQSQEELQTASIYENSFNEAISLARKDLTRPPSATPTIFAGGPRIRRWKGLDWTGLS